MKNFFSSTVYVILFTIALIFTSCQTDRDDILQLDDQVTITNTSATAISIQQASSFDGSFDNIVDRSSCFALNFPYTVTANGLDITIDSIDDLRLIEEIFDSIDDDIDILNIIFPITITLPDFTEVTINSTEELRELAGDCIEDGDDDDIECIDFVYPINFFTFNANEEQTGTVTVNSDRELRRFFASLDENDLISIEFPVILINTEGVEISVNSNAELRDAIERAKNSCDEDDDDDFNDDDFSEERFDFLLTECSWIIREVRRDGVDRTEQFETFEMIFSDDNEVVVRDREGNILIGTWNSRVTEDGAKLNLEFDTLVDFTLEWTVYEIADDTIKLFSGEGNRIIMKQDCDDDTDPDTLREVLRECSWIIKRVEFDGEEINRLLGYEFQFMPEGVVTLSNGDVISEGSWEITTNEFNRPVLAITLGGEPGVSFEWPLVDLRNERLKFEVEGFELVLLRECDESNDDSDISEIRNFLSGDEWIVTSFENEGIDETSFYEGFSLAFSPENRVVVSEGTDAIFSGLWRILRNDDDDIKFFLNLDNESDFDLFDQLTEAWYIESVTADRVEMVFEDENTNSKRVVFEKK